MATVGALAPAVFRVVLEGVVRFTPAARTFRAGEVDTMRITAVDNAGVALDVPPVVWTTNSAAIHVTAAGVLTALDEGAATITAKGRAFHAQQAYTVGTVFRGRVYALDQSETTGLIATVRVPGFADSARVAANGQFVIPSNRFLRGATGDFTVDAESGQARRFFPVLSPGAKFDAPDSLVTLLVPRVWRIQKGAYAGTDVPLTMAGAYGPDGGYGDYYPASVYSRIDGDMKRRVFLQTWSARDLPMAILIERSIHPDVPFRASDSTVFWDGARELERITGRSLFQPVMRSDVVGRPVLPSSPLFPLGTTLLYLYPDDPAMAAGRGGAVTGCYTNPFDRSVSWDVGDNAACFPAFDLISGSVSFFFMSLGSIGPASRSIIQHELLHVLGMGHTCAWPSVMLGTLGDASLSFCKSIGAPPVTGVIGPTAMDVAHLEVWWEAAAQARATKPRFRLLEAANGERVVLRGLPYLQRMSGFDVLYGK